MEKAGKRLLQLFIPVFEAFPTYARSHSRWTTWVVFGPMVTELLTAVALVFFPSALGYSQAYGVGLLLVVLLWGATAVVQVPAHYKLQQGFDLHTHRWLVQSNGFRTALWTVLGGGILYLLLGA